MMVVVLLVVIVILLLLGLGAYIGRDRNWEATRDEALRAKGRR